ncbi:MAG: leucine-rich repeat domain-containing protein [Candidatus Ornithomonoglobus sp.]
MYINNCLINAKLYIKECKIKNGCRIIADGVFVRCVGLTSVTIPDSVTEIGRNAFSRCERLTSITIPNSVTSIGNYAFGDCKSLTSITVDENNQHYSTINGVLFNKVKTILIRYPAAHDMQYVIPEGVTEIDYSAFSGCESLTSITIPEGVTSIDECAFCGCESLTSVTIPDSVTSIGHSAFERCGSLTSITLPDGVEIGYRAFCGCESLTSVTIPDSVTSIGGHAFFRCRQLTSVTIPDSVTSMCSGAFGDVNLKDIYYKGSENDWNKIEIGGKGNECLAKANIYFSK